MVRPSLLQPSCLRLSLICLPNLLRALRYPPLSGQVSLKLQKRLAASVLKCGVRKIWADPVRVPGGVPTAAGEATAGSFWRQLTSARR